MSDVDFGEQLRRAREKRGITQQTLADSLFVTRQTVSRWENGSRFPDLSTTKRIAQVLDISVGELVAAEKPNIILDETTLIETHPENAVATALYAALAVSCAVSVLSALLRMPSVKYISRADIWIIAMQSICIGLGFFVSCMGLMNSMRGKMSPGKAGVISCTLWLVCFLSDFSIATNVGSESMIPIIAVSIPSMIGVFTAYLFYFRNNATARWVIYALSLWGIGRVLYTLGTMIVFANQYITADTVLSAISIICISVLFVFQARTVYKIRLAEVQPQRNNVMGMVAQ